MHDLTYYPDRPVFAADHYPLGYAFDSFRDSELADVSLRARLRRGGHEPTMEQFRRKLNGYAAISRTSVWDVIGGMARTRLDDLSIVVGPTEEREAMADATAKWWMSQSDVMMYR